MSTKTALREELSQVPGVVPDDLQLFDRLCIELGNPPGQRVNLPGLLDMTDQEIIHHLALVGRLPPVDVASNITTMLVAKRISADQ